MDALTALRAQFEEAEKTPAKKATKKVEEAMDNTKKLDKLRSKIEDAKIELQFPENYNTGFLVIEGKIKVNGTHEVPTDNFILFKIVNFFH